MRVPGIPYVQGRNNYTDGDRSKYGIAIHNTSNNASDEGEANYARRRPDGTSSHFYVDSDSVTQSIDTHDRAGHAGSTHGNDHGIAVEITGANGWSRDKWLRSVAWDKLAAVLATVIRHHWPDGSFKVRRATVAQMRANPKVKAFYGHDDMRRAWGGTDHTDPGPNFPWDRLLDSVATALRAASKPATAPPATPSTPKENDDMPTPAELVTALLGAKLGKGTRTVGMQLQDLSLAGTVRDLAAESKLREEAILAAVQGADTATILARVNGLAAELREQAEAERQRDAELRALVEQGLDGTDDPAEVIRRIGALLATAAPDDA